MSGDSEIEKPPFNLNVDDGGGCLGNVGGYVSAAHDGAGGDACLLGILPDAYGNDVHHDYAHVHDPAFRGYVHAYAVPLNVTICLTP